MEKNLGQLLLETLEREESEKRAKEEAMRLRKEEIKREKQKRINEWFEQQKVQITEYILKGQKVKNVKVPYFLLEGDNKLRFEYFTDFVAWLGDNGLKMSFQYVCCSNIDQKGIVMAISPK